MSFKKAGIILLAIIAGEIALVLFTTVAQEVIVDGVYLESSSIFDLMLGGTSTLLAGVISGYVAAMIARNSMIPQSVISLLIAVESIYLISSGKINNPIWFDTLSAFMLILSVWLGYYVFHKFKKIPKAIP